jgi:hypothetical protein
VFEQGNKALVILGPHKRDTGYIFVPPVWRLSDIDFIYRQIHGLLGLIFTGGGYYERIVWAKVNNLITVDEVNRSAQLKANVDYNERESGFGRWAQWAALSFQQAQVGSVHNAIFERYSQLLDKSIGIVQPNGSIVYNELIQTKPPDAINKPPPESPFGDLTLLKWAVVALGAAYVFNTFRDISK